MCGILGIASTAKVGDITDFRDRLTHRGPDGAGNWTNESGTVALAHRRLAIIDLSNGSAQPLVSEDGRYVIVFNGEIYNYREIRNKLEQRGHCFRSAGDTEVVLAAYIEWGASCLDHFNGMFALAIYDAGGQTGKEQLFVARDRVGKKPFYYRHRGRDFEFASELKGIRSIEGIDIQALNYYLAFGYIPFDLCIARNVRKLPPAHAGIFDFVTGNFKTWRYWDLPDSPVDAGREGHQLAEESWEILKDAVSLRFRSDVPIGVFLSGGLDSSLIVAAAAEMSTQKVKTFTLAVPGSRLDESAHAQLIADYFGTEHHVLEFPEPSLEVLDELAPFVDEPLADSSILPTYMVSRLTAQHVKVALGGDGGDELYGGYGHYQMPLHDRAHWGWIPQSLLSCAARIVSKLPAGVRGRNRIASMRAGTKYTHVWGSPYFDIDLRRRIFHHDIIAQLGEELERPERTLMWLMQPDGDVVSALCRADFYSVLPDDFLVKVDRSSMANSLEVRSPFLDYRMVEHAFGCIPSAWKVNLSEKRLIQNLMAKKYLPNNFKLNRKQGFSVPIDKWMRQSQIHELVKRVSDDVINKQELNRLLNGLFAGRANGSRLFSLIMLFISMENLFSRV